jgi:hypothetical protein
MSSDVQRGTVKKITFEVEYPDGSLKTSVIEDAEDVASITFYPERVSPRDLQFFNKSSSDWRENPTMLVYRGKDPDPFPDPFCWFTLHKPIFPNVVQPDPTGGPDISGRPDNAPDRGPN